MAIINGDLVGKPLVRTERGLMLPGGEGLRTLDGKIAYVLYFSVDNCLSANPPNFEDYGLHLHVLCDMGETEMQVRDDADLVYLLEKAGKTHYDELRGMPVTIKASDCQLYGIEF